MGKRAGDGGSRGRAGRRDGRPLHLLRKSSAAIPDPPIAGRRTCVLLLSGGLDSATCLALVSRWGWTVHALSFDYGQRHRVEIDAARALARRYGVASHRVIAIPSFGALGGSALTDRSIRVPKKALGKARIPVTYVPARNTLFLAFALGAAETAGATEIVIGANALDYSGYPDCRPAFLRAFERVANLGTKAGDEGRRFAIRAPLLRLLKARIVRLALALGLDPGLTTSCYDPAPRGRPCGACDSCLLRAKGFAEAGAADPRAR
ncbi:MAG TPA: 7-cyano-7-deazaguanine synthase QueC [Thermoanaerobaculia bacterium]|nr:7-cyano-7-deazaguanine synthase QueC [Thermoanaerobaculia bacterium]